MEDVHHQFGQQKEVYCCYYSYSSSASNFPSNHHFFFFFFPLGDLELLNSSIVSFVPLKENVTRKVQKLGVAFKENDRR